MGLVTLLHTPHVGIYNSLVLVLTWIWFNVYEVQLLYSYICIPKNIRKDDVFFLAFFFYVTENGADIHNEGSKSSLKTRSVPSFKESSCPVFLFSVIFFTWCVNDLLPMKPTTVNIA